MQSHHGFLWIDVAGLALTAEDKEILAHPAISGVILFSKNYESVAQLQALTHQINTISPHLVITVDQEGGRVQRFREGFTELPSMHAWAEQADNQHAFSNTLTAMVNELRNVGVYSSLLPVLDINYDRNAVIGHRSFGNLNQVSVLGEWMIDQLHQLKMPVTGKHFPGHGWVTVDSHIALPIDDRSFEEIDKTDLQPFKKLAKKCDAMMLAHIVYSQVDTNPVCFSSYWIREILQKQLNFTGLVMSDDLSMQAVMKWGSYADRARCAIDAGCDVLLVCNAREGVIDIVDHAPLSKNKNLAEKLACYRRFH